MSSVTRISALVMLAMACVTARATLAEDAPDIKGEKVTVKGEVIDVWCYMEGGDKGKDHKACGIACVKAGNPIGILDEKGNVYIVMGGQKDHQPGRDLLVDKISETVTVEGTLAEKGGSKVLFVKTVK